MSVVFGVAVGLGGEEGGTEVGDLGGSLGENVGIPGRHGGWLQGGLVRA
jgi:hypothetical protein